MTPDPVPPANLGSYRASLNARLRNVAKARGVSPVFVRKQYVFTKFLNRVFTQAAEGWVLLGGNALLIRTGGGRFTQDIDLARQGELPAPQSLQQELQTYCRPPDDGDYWFFDIKSVESRDNTDQYGYGTHAIKVKVASRLGTKTFEEFTIDITQRRHVDGAVDHVPLRAVIDDDTGDELVSVPTVPVENHLADKICAMYERHGAEQKPSSRMRDLADIVRIVQALRIDAERLRTVLDREAGRRKIQLPAGIVEPDPKWATDFPREARTFAEYPDELHSLEASLGVASKCLNEILAGERTSGVWKPRSASWVPPEGASEADQ